MRLRSQAAQTRWTLLVGIAVLFLLWALPATAHARETSAHSQGNPSPATTIPALQDPTQLDAEESAALVAINQQRQLQGLDPLTLSPALSHAAQWMVHDLVNQSHLTHTDSRGLALRARVSEFGHPTTAPVAENVGRGFPTGARVVDAMFGSPSHQANLLRTDTPAIAIARTTASDIYRSYWVFIVGSDPATAPATDATTRTTRIVPLVSGWNLVSWLGASQPVADATATIRPIIQRLWGWSATQNEAHAWAVYGTNDDHVTILPHGEAVWLLVDRTDTAYWGQIVDGGSASADSNATVTLNAGWSLVTWLGADGVTLRDATATLVDTINSLVTFDALAQRYDVHRPQLAQATPAAVLQHGQPLWVHTSHATVWIQSP